MCILIRSEQIFVITGEFLTQWPHVSVIHGFGETPYLPHDHLITMSWARRRPLDHLTFYHMLFLLHEIVWQRLVEF